MTQNQAATLMCFGAASAEEESACLVTRENSACQAAASPVWRHIEGTPLRGTTEAPKCQLQSVFVRFLPPQPSQSPPFHNLGWHSVLCFPLWKSGQTEPIPSALSGQLSAVWPVLAPDQSLEGGLRGGWDF